MPPLVHPALDATHMQESLVQVELIPAQSDEFSDSEPMPVDEENHRVIPQPMPADTASGLPQSLHFGGGEVLPRADVRMFVTLGKGKRGHQELLLEQLSCLRWVDPGNGHGATLDST